MIEHLDRVTAGEAILHLWITCLRSRVEPKLAFIEIDEGVIRCRPKTLDKCRFFKEYLLPFEAGSPPEAGLDIVTTSTARLQRGVLFYHLRRKELLLLLPCREMANPVLMFAVLRELGLDSLPVGFARRRKDGRIRRIPNLRVLYRFLRLHPDIQIYV